MASEEEKSFPPSKRKLKKERAKGNVWVSTNFASAVYLLIALFFLSVLFRFFPFENIFYSTFSQLNSLTVEKAFKNAFEPLLFRLYIFFFICVLATFFVYVLQRGWIWTWKRENSFFKKRKKRWIFPLFKTFFAFLISVFFLKTIRPNSLVIFSTSREKVHFIYEKIFIFSFLLILTFLATGVIDLFFQRWSFFRKMRMTKKEVEDEKREEEIKKKNRL